MPRLTSWLGGPLGVVGVSTALTLAMAAPVLQDPTTRLFGTEIVGRHHDPFTAIAWFEHPQRPNLYTQPATDYLGAALVALGAGGVSAYNLVVLTTFPLAALFASLLAMRVTGSVPSAWLGGLFYAFTPFHVAHAAYHPHVAQTQWLPLYLLALWLCLEGVSLINVLFLAMAAILVALSNFYCGLVAACLTPVMLVGYGLFLAPKRGGSIRRSVAGTGLAVVVLAMLGLEYVLQVAPRVMKSPGSLAFPREDLLVYCARWWSYLIPPVEHPLFGDFAQAVWERHGIGRGLLEQQVTLGFGLLLLSGVAFLFDLLLPVGFPSSGPRVLSTRFCPCFGHTLDSVWV